MPLMFRVQVSNAKLTELTDAFLAKVPFDVEQSLSFQEHVEQEIRKYLFRKYAEGRRILHNLANVVIIDQDIVT